METALTKLFNEKTDGEQGCLCTKCNKHFTWSQTADAVNHFVDHELENIEAIMNSVLIKTYAKGIIIGILLAVCWMWGREYL